jgi:hypothetical protein
MASTALVVHSRARSRQSVDHQVLSFPTGSSAAPEPARRLQRRCSPLFFQASPTIS